MFWSNFITKLHIFIIEKTVFEEMVPLNTVLYKYNSLFSLQLYFLKTAKLKLKLWKAKIIYSFAINKRKSLLFLLLSFVGNESFITSDTI